MHTHTHSTHFALVPTNDWDHLFGIVYRHRRRRRRRVDKLGQAGLRKTKVKV